MSGVRIHRDQLSLADEASQERAKRILALLGWKVVRGAGTATIEPGDQAIDGPRQQIFPALGIDELAMQETLEAGRSFQFEILSEEASSRELGRERRLARSAAALDRDSARHRSPSVRGIWHGLCA